ncbi:hypothetical protein [Paracraurococcus ruber]|uniref:Glycosyl transferases group 1 n=1 Tax=Paracraurococcus ruber TaxID=77675 RepID=A0ABS1CVW4_9PROT|nr:hypothetical protein [Paracraurococcus ruber]MBK1658097.1 hypothetical protein [Paracraurococcus ruber]TDG32350.1 hypothetical protein E2C05_07475 [Paracraurococcus ruber]
MRILWVGKAPEDERAGDEVFDRRTIAALRARGHAVALWHPRRLGRLRQVLNRLRGVPHYRTWFEDAANRSALAAAAAAQDAVIVSWEPLDGLRPSGPVPALLVLHNVTSRSLRSIFPRNPLARILAAGAARWERATYRPDRWAAIATLAKADDAHVRALPARPHTLLTIPGMPPLAPLAPDAMLRAELVVAGTFDWRPKRRDLLRFARDYAALPVRLPVRGEGWPAEIERLLPPLPPPTAEEIADGIRFGIVTDRFEAGHKLKTLAHIAANQVVLSFAEVGADIAEIPDHRFFLRRIATAADIPAHVAELAAMDPALLRQRLAEFKRRCAARFTWDAVAGTLEQALLADRPASAPAAATSPASHPPIGRSARAGA